jgi:UDP-glucose 4-epimerase
MAAGSPLPIAVVTGGAGFIGSHMVDLLRAKGYGVRVIDNLVGGREANLAHHHADNAVTLDRRDLLDIAADDAIFADAAYVFHFAGIGDIVPSIDHPVDYMRANVMGTVAALEGARAAQGGKGVRKFVYAASSTCYGLAATPTKEDHPIDPQYPYALSKNMGEQATFHWHQLYGLPSNSIRIFNAYGTRSRTTGAYGAVFGVFLKQKLSGQPFTVVGDGHQSRDFIYVTDVASAFWAAADTAISGQAFNVGAGNPQSVNQLVALLGGDKVHIPKRPGEPDSTWADISKIRDQLGWSPSIRFDEGVARIVENIEYWSEAPLWTPENIAPQTETWFKYLDPDNNA